MGKKIKRVFKVFFAWQEDQEAAWLEEMAEKGWFLVRYNLIYYTFEQGQPGKYIYKFDYKDTTNKDLQEYIQIFQDAGWEHVTQYTNWHYFRKKDEGTPFRDIYSDNQSKIQKYKGLLRTLSIIFLVNIINVVNLGLNIFDDDHGGQAMGTSSNVLWVFVALLCLLLGYCIFRIYRRIQKLKTEI